MTNNIAAAIDLIRLGLLLRLRKNARQPYRANSPTPRKLNTVYNNFHVMLATWSTLILSKNAQSQKLHFCINPDLHYSTRKKIRRCRRKKVRILKVNSFFYYLMSYFWRCRGLLIYWIICISLRHIFRTNETSLKKLEALSLIVFF